MLDVLLQFLGDRDMLVSGAVIQVLTEWCIDVDAAVLLLRDLGDSRAMASWAPSTWPHRIRSASAPSWPRGAPQVRIAQDELAQDLIEIGRF